MDETMRAEVVRHIVAAKRAQEGYMACLAEALGLELTHFDGFSKERPSVHAVSVSVSESVLDDLVLRGRRVTWEGLDPLPKLFDTLGGSCPDVFNGMTLYLEHPSFAPVHLGDVLPRGHLLANIETLENGDCVVGSYRLVMDKR